METNGGFDTIIDSGTTIMYGPPDAVTMLYSHVPGARVYDEDEGLWEYPCATPPNLSFSWGGRNWEVTAEKCVSCFGDHPSQ